MARTWAARPDSGRSNPGRSWLVSYVMDDQLSRNKRTVVRFNQEVIAEGNVASFEELMHPDFRNHSAPPGADNGPAGMLHTFNQVLRPALADLQVQVHAQVAEGDLVTTRKTITGRHTGALLGIPPTGKPVAIEVMDMVRLREDKYYEHWGVNTLAAVLAQLRG